MAKRTGIIYCRVSSVEQVEGTSLESQERMCREYCEREGIEILETFIEKGESAKTANRTEFNKAILFCQKNKKKVSYFVVYKIDRFARNQADHAVVRVKLRELGTELKSVSEPIDDTPVGRAMEGMLAVFAEFDNNVRTERTKNGMYERVKQGVWVWQAPLGYYRKEKGANLSIDPETAPFVRMIFEEYAKGIYTYKSLAAHLSKNGYRTKRGKKPCHQLIEKIIRNPLYCGVIRTMGEEFKASFDPIIDWHLFEQCQGRRKKPANTPRTAKNPHFPLRKLAVCDACRHPLTGSRSTGRMGAKYAYYHHHRQDCRKAHSIPKEEFEKAFKEYLERITPDETYELAFKAIVIDIWKTNYKNLDADNAITRKEIEKLEQERIKTFDLHRAGIYSDSDFVLQKSLINRQIDEKHALLNDRRIEEFNMEEALSYAFNLVRSTADKWSAFEYPERVRFQKMIFDGNVEFDGEKFGNGELSLIYKGNQDYGGSNSKLVRIF